MPEEEFNTRFAAWVTGVGITSSHNFYCSNGSVFFRSVVLFFAAIFSAISLSLSRCGLCEGRGEVSIRLACPDSTQL